MGQLQFTVTNQWITRIDNFKPVAKSKNYLYAEFDFQTEEWISCQLKTAIFRNLDTAYEVLLDADNQCLVPWELLQSGGDFIYVSVFCGDLVTANKAPVRIYESGWSDDLESSSEPTPSVYAQISERLRFVENMTVTAESLPEGSEPIAMYDKGNLTLGIPKGDTGATGDKGDTGETGNGIEHITKTGTDGNVDTYTITMTDGTTAEFTVTNAPTDIDGGTFEDWN